MDEYDLSPDELWNAFETIQSRKSSGLDDIDSKVVKNVYDVIEYPLMYIFNLSLKNGVFPDRLKLARVVPVFKSGDDSTLSNYRPISILPCFSKILELIMYDSLHTSKIITSSTTTNTDLKKATQLNML
ncbi:uncharacterized protein LOC136079482 [Hydra vulgaris]|uniref:Uncharacterized protein LOC136079482 n=1 Tax=Hydra vulgaris TaxID=6087 RepID=A0ABM4BQ72_HYDVU